jgi:hypothetical protein
MQYFVTVFAQSSDFHPALFQKVDGIGEVSMYEDPLTAPAFCCSYHRIEAMHCFLTYSL